MMTGLGFLNELADLLKLPPETTGITLTADYDDAVRLEVRQVVSDESLAGFRRVISHFRLVADGEQADAESSRAAATDQAVESVRPGRSGFREFF